MPCFPFRRALVPEVCLALNYALARGRADARPLPSRSLLRLSHGLEVYLARLVVVEDLLRLLLVLGLQRRHPGVVHRLVNDANYDWHRRVQLSAKNRA